MNLLTSLLFPPKCVLCGKLLENGEIDLCADCRKSDSRYQNQKIHIPFLDSFTAVWYYEGNVRCGILHYKFYHARSRGAAFGRILGDKVLQTYPDGFDLLTWVPVSTLRKMKRGYDQSQLIAQAVGRELGIRSTPLLKKVRHTPPQSGISDASMRRANVSGAYRVRKGVDVAGKRILLVDDVFTTGATAGECARILKINGAKEVHCAAVAAARK